jgi:hypothetical protein
MRHKIHLIITAIAACVPICSCASPKVQTLSDEKVLLQVSFEDATRLLTKLGFTNNVTGAGPVTRDSHGTKLFTRVEPRPSSKVQQLRTQQLIVVTAKGVHIKPWHYSANEVVSDDEEVAVWEHPGSDGRWEVRGGEVLNTNCWKEDVSGDWIAVGADDRAPWIAKLDAPNIPVAELPDSPRLIAIRADGANVHVFARKGWRNEEGQMKYYVFDFSRGDAKPIKQVTFPWARILLDMDPQSEYAVLNDNSRFWGRSWLLNLKTGKRKSISTSDWTLIVNKEVADKWIELTKP